MKYYSKVESDEIYKAPENRTRNRGAINNIGVNYFSYYWNTLQNPKPVKPAKVSDSSIGLYESMYDVVTYGYKGLSSRGKIVNSPMSKTSVEWAVKKNATVYFKAVENASLTYHWELEGCLLTTRPRSVESMISTVSTLCNGLESPDYSTMTALASTEARAGIAEPDFEGLVSLGEMSQTLRLIANPFRTGLKLAQTLNRKIDRVDPSKGQLAADISSLYLEFRYGIRPLIKEVEGALLNLAASGFSFDRKTSRAKQTFLREGNSSSLVNYGSNIWYDQTLHMKRENTIKCGFLYQTEFSSGAQSRWGMRLSDIPSAMWELVPMSFIYDWVANVGDFISALTPRAGVNILSQWTTREETLEVTLSGGNYRILNVPKWFTVTQGSCESSGKVVFKTRSPIVQAPSIAWRGFDKVSSDVFKVLDLIGIFDQKLNNAAQGAMRKQNTQDAMVRKGSRLTTRLNRF